MRAMLIRSDATLLPRAIIDIDHYLKFFFFTLIFAIFFPLMLPLVIIFAGFRHDTISPHFRDPRAFPP